MVERRRECGAEAETTLLHTTTTATLVRSLISCRGYSHALHQGQISMNLFTIFRRVFTARSTKVARWCPGRHLGGRNLV